MSNDVYVARRVKSVKSDKSGFLNMAWGEKQQRGVVSYGV